jgi:catechol 2,3-dioxygenase-like lactoylglutathione lyase family enzyme
VPSKERNYPIDPAIKVVGNAAFHSKKITNVAIVAKDFEGMFRFYRDRVGLKPIVGSEHAAYALLNGSAGHGDFALFRPRPGLQPGMHHVGFQVWDEADLERSLAMLPAKGITVERDWTPRTIATMDVETALYAI